MAFDLIHANSIYAAPSAAAHAVRFGQTIYTSGLLPKNRSGEIAHKSDVVGQTKLVLENLAAVLKAAGTSIDDLAKITFYVAPAATGHLEDILGVRDAT